MCWKRHTMRDVNNNISHVKLIWPEKSTLLDKAVLQGLRHIPDQRKVKTRTIFD